jgi:hypothetical protein
MIKVLVRVFLLLILIAPGKYSSAQQPLVTINAQVWADNWYAVYVDEKLIAEDPVPITTERSFNAETFSFSTALPAQFALIIKDFKENDSGLEYIGSRRQQIGDGGFIAQFRDATSNELLAVSNESWTCKAIHQAPLNKSCERSAQPLKECQSNIIQEPSNWMSSNFDDSQWPNAIVHSARAVRPHGGYSSYSWEPFAKLIWTEDLEIDNTILCRFTLE